MLFGAGDLGTAAGDGNMGCLLVLVVRKRRASGVFTGNPLERKRTASGVVPVQRPEIIIPGAADQHTGVIVDKIPRNAAILAALHQIAVAVVLITDGVAVGEHT